MSTVNDQSTKVQPSSKSRVRKAHLGALLALALSISAPAWATTYFVDPASGNDANAGTSQSAPWKTVPGMSGASSWGAISSGNKVPAATTIEIKAGSTFTGKRWLIDTTYYQAGTSTGRTTIRVSPTWGSGNVVLDGSGASVPAYNGGVQISSDMHYITLTGVDSTRRIEIKNYSGHAGILLYHRGGPSTRAKWNEFKWFDVHHNSTNGIATDWQDNSLLQDGLTHHNGAVEGGGASTNGAGALIGDAADAGGSNNIIRRVKAYSNGINARPNDGSTSIGFQQTGSVNLLFDSCEAYGNGRDGFDGGRADNAGDSSVTFVNTYSHDNGEDGFGLNSGPTGNVVAKHVNTIAARNKQANWTTYDGAHLEVYNSVGIGAPYNFHAFASYSGWPVPTIKIRNSYLGVLSGGRQVHYYNQQAAGYPKFDSNYNIWVPNASNSEAWDDDGTGKTYAAPPSWRGAQDKIGIANVQAFINFGNDDFHLASVGPAVKAGESLSLLGTLLGSLLDLLSKDKDGKTRTSPPDIGAYQYGTATPSALSPPTNLRVVK
jgi:hypothetical protein